jgi:hypothetical protein
MSFQISAVEEKESRRGARKRKTLKSIEAS